MNNLNYDECFKRIWFQKGFYDSEQDLIDAQTIKISLIDKINERTMVEKAKNYKDLIIFDVFRKNYLNSKNIFMINYTLLVSLILNWKTYDHEISKLLESVLTDNNELARIENLKELVKKNELLKYISFNDYVKSIEKDENVFFEVLRIREIVDIDLKDKKVWFKEEVNKRTNNIHLNDVDKQQQIEEIPYIVMLDDIIQSTDPIMVPYFVRMILNDFIEDEEFRIYISKLIDNGGNEMSVKTLSPSGEVIAKNEILSDSSLQSIFHGNSPLVQEKEDMKIIVNNPEYELLNIEQYNKDAIASMQAKQSRGENSFFSKIKSFFTK